MSIRVLDRVWKESRSVKGARLVLLSLADFADDNGKSYPSNRAIAAKVNLCERAVRYAVAELVGIGELGVQPFAGPMGCNVYYVLPTKAGDKGAAFNGNAPGANNAPGAKSGMEGGQSLPERGANFAPKPSGNRHRTVKRDKSLSPAAPKGERFSISDLESIYQEYPRKVAKEKALTAIKKALGKIAKRPETADAVGWLRGKVQAYAASRQGEDQHFTPHPTTWFNAGRYDDEDAAQKSQSKLPDYFDQNRNAAGPAVKPMRSMSDEIAAAAAELKD